MNYNKIAAATVIIGFPVLGYLESDAVLKKAESLTLDYTVGDMTSYIPDYDPNTCVIESTISTPDGREVAYSCPGQHGTASVEAHRRFTNNQSRIYLTFLGLMVGLAVSELFDRRD